MDTRRTPPQEVCDWFLTLVLVGGVFAVAFTGFGLLTLFPSWMAGMVEEGVFRRLLWWGSLGFSLVAGFVLIRLLLGMWWGATKIVRYLVAWCSRGPRSPSVPVVYATYEDVSPVRRTRPDTDD